MIIASNTPLSFKQNPKHKFYSLWNEQVTPDMVILILPRNWGAGSVHKIAQTLACVKNLDTDLPCLLVGAESTIPNEEVNRYRHKERDQLISQLTEEVLKRSKSIGVRGHITQKHLSEIIGLDKEQIDIIYDKSDDDNLSKIKHFLKKNGFDKLESIAEDLLLAQAKPNKCYEAPPVPGNVIVIKQPYITTDGDSARLNADIDIDGNVTTLWCETQIEYKESLLEEKSDAFLVGLLPYALRAHRNIVCEAPTTEQLLHNINDILIPHLCLYDPRLYPTKVDSQISTIEPTQASHVATGMSCGVDSLYSAVKYSDPNLQSLKLTHLYCGNYLYGNSGPIYDRAELVSKELDLPLIKTTTNINEVLGIPHLPTHFFKAMFGVLSVSKTIRAYYYSTAENLGIFNLKNNGTRDTIYMELMLLFVFSTPHFQVLSGGGATHRLDKTKLISNSVAAQKFLNVCLYPKLEVNCGKCDKCRRTLLTLDCIGALDKFDRVFDISEYKFSRLEYFVYLIKKKTLSSLRPVFAHFLKHEPELLAEASKVLES